MNPMAKRPELRTIKRFANLPKKTNERTREEGLLVVKPFQAIGNRENCKVDKRYHQYQRGTQAASKSKPASLIQEESSSDGDESCSNDDHTVTLRGLEHLELSKDEIRESNLCF